jgi:transcriptional regulator GlxA family with amidase domain
MTRTVGVYIYDDVEVLDFAGPYEVFTTATRMHARQAPADPAPFRVLVIGRTLAPVHARAGLKIDPEFGLKNHPPLDVLIVPGGVVTDEMKQPDVATWLARVHERASITASVCTGVFLLAQAGLLANESVTTHWEDVDELRATFPRLTVVTGCRWVDEGRIVSSAGISAGIDMSLHLVERLAGRALAERTARQMDFDWTENA